MHNKVKRVAAVLLTVCLSFGALAGCSRKDKDAFDAAKEMLTLKDGSSIDAGTANLYLRYEQAEFENGIGQFLKSYYGTDIWSADMYGNGEAYGNTFKQQILEDMQQMLLDEKHAADYGVELTDADKKAISDAAGAFIAANGEEVLGKMSATTETAERMLTLLTIKQRVEEAMTADVDTEVSDEEAAQRIVKYVQFTATVPQESEAETEELSEAVSEAGEAVAEAVTAEVEPESDEKTGSAEESATEAAESASEAAESVTEAAAEQETETPEMVAARAVAIEKAEAFLATVMQGGDFVEQATAAAADDLTVYSAEYTFGDSDTYPDAAIIEATKGLEDGTIVDHVIEVGNAYYVLYVEDAFNEEATEAEKETIVNQRKREAINAVYDGWLESEDESFTLDSAAWTSLIFDIALAYEVEASTEALSEAAGEAMSEGENVAEQITE